MNENTPGQEMMHQDNENPPRTAPINPAPEAKLTEAVDSLLEQGTKPGKKTVLLALEEAKHLGEKAEEARQKARLAKEEARQLGEKAEETRQKAKLAREEAKKKRKEAKNAQQKALIAVEELRHKEVCEAKDEKLQVIQEARKAKQKVKLPAGNANEFKKPAGMGLADKRSEFSAPLTNLSETLTNITSKTTMEKTADSSLQTNTASHFEKSELLLEIKSNKSIAKAQFTGKLLPFQTGAWDRSFYEAFTLPVDSLKELSEAYIDIRLANELVWLSEVVGHTRKEIEESYLKLRTSIADRLDKALMQIMTIID